MKRFKYFFLALASLALAASCTQKEEPFEPGEPDVAGCYGVYFPVQDASGAHTYDPTMPTTVEFTVKRTNSSGAITVPVSYTESEAGIFQVGTLSFADGQEETTLKVDFPNSDVGVNYSLSLLIDDPQYVSRYADSPVSIDFSVLRVEWKYFLNPKTGEKALFTWNQGWWGETATGYLKYYEVGNKRTCQTETIGHVYSGEAYDGYGFWGTGSSAENAVEWTFYWYTNTKNDDGYNFIRIPMQFSGYHHSSYDADVMVLDYYYWDTSGDSDSDFLSYAAKNSGTVSYYDGNGGFYLSVRSYYMFGTGGWNPGTYDTIGIAEGFVRTDYSIEMSLDFAQDGILPVSFVTGKDVASIKVAGYEGELTATQVANKVAAISAGEDEAEVISTEDFEYDEDEDALYGSAGLSFDKSGIYTVVAVACDSAGTAQGSASAVHSYVSGDDIDEYAVNLTVGAEPTPERYESYDRTSSFAFYLVGKDITEAHVAILEAAKYDAAADDYNAAVKEATNLALDAGAIAAVNGEGGYYDIASGLAANTEHVVLVWATNGNEETYATARCTTDGLPNEIVAENGCFGYLLVFNEEEGVPYYDYLPLEFNPNNGNYEIKNWGYGTTFSFSYDEETGKISVPQQPTGFANATYGTLYVGDSSMLPQSWIDYFGIDVEPESYVDEEGNFHLYLSYISTGGYYFGTGYETYYINGEPEEDPAVEPGEDESSQAEQLHVGVSKTFQSASYTGKNHEHEVKPVSMTVSTLAPQKVFRDAKAALNGKLTDHRR